MNIKCIKSVLAGICLALLTAGPLMADSQGNLVISETRVDFGAMIEGKVAEKVVTLSNTGDQPLTVANVTTS